MKSIKKATLLIVTAVCMAFAGPDAVARKIRTRHSIPKNTEKTSVSEKALQLTSISMATDSVAFCDSIIPAIRFYGFDKTVGSNTESFFTSNGLKKTLVGMEIMITYTDIKGRQLHRRTVKLDCDIPAEETKRIDIKSWDTQRSFYFHRSLKPKRQATPFDVKIELLSVTL